MVLCENVRYRFQRSNSASFSTIFPLEKARNKSLHDEHTSTALPKIPRTIATDRFGPTRKSRISLQKFDYHEEVAKSQPAAKRRTDTANVYTADPKNPVWNVHFFIPWSTGPLRWRLRAYGPRWQARPGWWKICLAEPHTRKRYKIY